MLVVRLILVASLLTFPTFCAAVPAQATVTIGWKNSKGQDLTDPLSNVPLCTTVTIYVNPDGKTKFKSSSLILSVQADDKAITAGTIEITDAESKTPDATILTIQVKKGVTTTALTGLSVGKHRLNAMLKVNDDHESKSTDKTAEVDVSQPATTSAVCVVQMPPPILTVVGVNVEAASSTSPQATFLGNVSLDFPLGLGTTLVKPMSDIRDAHFFVSGSLRLAGMAQPGALSASAFTSSYYASAINSTPDKIVQSWEGSVSLSAIIAKTNWKLGTFDEGTSPSPDYPSVTLMTTSVIATAGFNSPLSASQANPPVYYATNQIQQEFSPNSGSWPATCAVTTGNPTCYVSFIPADRSRFYRYYEAGLRMRIYGEDFANKTLRAPGIVDITVGQNEYVTGGGLRGVVAHLTGVMPIPIPKIDGFYAFGSIASELNGKIASGNQLLLLPVPSTANVNYLSSSVFSVTVPQPNRDRYRFGFGIDLFKLLSAAKQKTNATSNSDTSAAKAAK